MCPTPCEAPARLDLKASCPLPVPRWGPENPEVRGLGDIVEAMAKPIARALHLDCVDKNGNLKAESGCAKRKEMLNRFGQTFRPTT